MSILVELSGGCYEDCERLPLPKALGSIASAFFDGCRQNLIQY